MLHIKTLCISLFFFLNIYVYIYIITANLIETKLLTFEDIFRSLKTRRLKKKEQKNNIFCAAEHHRPGWIWL